MSGIRVNHISIDIWEDGYPIWVKIRGHGDNEITINHMDLNLFKAAIEEAIRRCLCALPGENKDEIR